MGVWSLVVILSVFMVVLCLSSSVCRRSSFVSLVLCHRFDLSAVVLGLFVVIWPQNFLLNVVQFQVFSYYPDCM